MRILLWNWGAWPSTGGTEKITHALACEWSRLGHSVTLMTETPLEHERDIPYKIFRQPSLLQRVRLIQDHDLLHCYTPNTRLSWLAFLLHKPCVWTHPCYRLASIDGFGWVDGQPAPVQPHQSFIFHWKKYGPALACYGLVQLSLRNMTACLVNANVAVSAHVKQRQPCPRQIVIYEPHDSGDFPITTLDAALQTMQCRESTFTFVGRISSEKGVDVLLKAFALFLNSERQTNGQARSTLKIIGDGPEKPKLQQLQNDLKIGDRVLWCGIKHGHELREEITRGGIGVVPSLWEEPGGTVVSEFMACGKPVIIAEPGGMAEKCAAAGRVFPRGVVAALNQSMVEVAGDEQLQIKMISEGLQRAREFTTNAAALNYIRLFETILHRREGTQFSCS